MGDLDLDSMSVEQLLALKQQAIPSVPASVAAPSDLDSLSVDELLKLKNSSVNKDWNITDSAKNFGSGVVEGTTGLLGLASDVVTQGAKGLTPFSTLLFGDAGKPNLNFEYSKMFDKAVSPYLAEKDPQYRYARTLGNFAAPVPVKGANTIKGLLKSLISGTAAQAAQDITGDAKIAPLVAAVGTGGAISAGEDLLSLLKRAFVGSSKAEIAGSAAKTFAEKTGLTTKDLATVNAKPLSPLEALQTTAERTGNVGAAQMEKTLAATGNNAALYDALDKQRTAAREGIINTGSDVTAVNKEGLGDTLINTAENVQGKMQKNSSAFWSDVPREEVIPISAMQENLLSLAKNRQAGLEINSKVKDLVSQVVAREDGALTSGALQDIRSDALSLMRDKDLTGFEKKLLTNLTDNIDSSMATGLSEQSYQTWKAARQSTAAEKEIFGRGTVGNYLTSDNAKTSNVLSKVFKGDTQATTELKAAIGESPEVLEKVKRGVLDMIPRDANGNLTTAKMKSFLAANEGGIKSLFGESFHSNLKKIYDDLKSQGSVKDLAFLASKGNSVTAQKATVAGALQEAITESLVPGVGGRFSGIIDAIKQGAGIKDAKAVEDLLFKASLDPRFAEQLSKSPTNKRIFNALESLNNAKNSAGKTGSLMGAKELSREQDNRSPMAKLLDKVLAKAQPTQEKEIISKVGEPMNKATKELSRLGLMSLAQLSPVALDSAQQPLDAALQQVTLGRDFASDITEFGTPQQGAETMPKSEDIQLDVLPTNKTKRVKAVEQLIDSDPIDATIYEIESARNPKAKNPESSASGGFQLLKKTASTLGVKDVFDLADNYKGYLKLKEENQNVLSNLGLDPQDPEALYSLHYLGSPVFRKVALKKPLTETEQSQVNYLKKTVLPRFRKLYTQKTMMV